MRTMLVLALLAFAMPAYAANHAVQIKGMKFNPSKISVIVGDTITFTNADPMTHTATALDGSFDTQRAGAPRSRSLPQARIHSIVRSTTR